MELMQVDGPIRTPRPLGRRSEQLRSLRRRVRSRGEGEVIVDGRRLVTDLVRWGVPIRELYLSADLVGEPSLEGLVRCADRAWTVPEAAFAQVSPTRHPQGVLAIVDEPRPQPWSGRSGVALYLDRVQDPGNVGSVLRSAAALSAEAVLLSPGCADPFRPAAVRGSAGAVFRVPVERDVDVVEAADRARRGEGEVWATGADGVTTTAWRPRRPLLLLLGAEGEGLCEAAEATAGGRVTIPLTGGVESLNVAVAAGILLERLRTSCGVTYSGKVTKEG